MNREQATVVRWEDPPPTNRIAGSGRSRFNALAEQLRARPGVWAVIYDGASQRFTGLANHIRQGAIRCFAPAGDFDATTRSSAGRVRVYARYVGEGGGPR